MSPEAVRANSRPLKKNSSCDHFEKLFLRRSPESVLRDLPAYSGEQIVDARAQNAHKLVGAGTEVEQGGLEHRSYPTVKLQRLHKSKPKQTGRLRETVNRSLRLRQLLQ